MSLDPFSGQGNVVGKVRKKVVISLSARKTVITPRMPAQSVRPVQSAIPLPAEARIPSVIKERAHSKIKPVPVIVQEIPTPVTSSSSVSSESKSEVAEKTDTLFETVASADSSGSSEHEEDPDSIVARPLYRQNPSPEYPALARRRHLQGNVILEVLVNKNGRVEELFVKESSGYKVLDRAALKAVRGWLFEPGRKGTSPVSMKVLVPVRFSLR